MVAMALHRCFSTHMQDLQEVTQETHYENYRAEKLANGGGAPAKASRRWVVSLHGGVEHLHLLLGFFEGGFFFFFFSSPNWNFPIVYIFRWLSV